MYLLLSVFDVLRGLSTSRDIKLNEGVDCRNESMDGEYQFDIDSSKERDGLHSLIEFKILTKTEGWIMSNNNCHDFFFSFYDRN